MMDRAEWRRVKAITADALAVNGAERAAFVAAHCGSDESLRREVTSLLAAAVAATDLFEKPALTTTAALGVLADADGAPRSLVGVRIDRTTSSVSSAAEAWALPIWPSGPIRRTRSGLPSS